MAPPPKPHANEGEAAAAKVPEWQVPDDKPSSMPWLEVEEVTCGFCTKVRRIAAPATLPGNGAAAPAAYRAPVSAFALPCSATRFATSSSS